MWMLPIIWQLMRKDKDWQEQTGNSRHQASKCHLGGENKLSPQCFLVYNLHCPSFCKPIAFMGLCNQCCVKNAHWKWSPQAYSFLSPGLLHQCMGVYHPWFWQTLSEFFHFLHHLSKVAQGDNFLCQQLIWSEIMLLNFLHKSALFFFFSTAFFNHLKPTGCYQCLYLKDAIHYYILYQESQICFSEPCFLSRDIMKL